MFGHPVVMLMLGAVQVADCASVTLYAIPSFWAPPPLIVTFASVVSWPQSETLCAIPSIAIMSRKPPVQAHLQQTEKEQHVEPRVRLREAHQVGIPDQRCELESAERDVGDECDPHPLVVVLPHGL